MRDRPALDAEGPEPGPEERQRLLRELARTGAVPSRLAGVPADPREQRVLDALAGLTPQEREVLVATHVLGLDLTAAGRAAGLGSGTDATVDAEAAAVLEDAMTAFAHRLDLSGPGDGHDPLGDPGGDAPDPSSEDEEPAPFVSRRLQAALAPLGVLADRLLTAPDQAAASADAAEAADDDHDERPATSTTTRTASTRRRRVVGLVVGVVVLALVAVATYALRGTGEEQVTTGEAVEATAVPVSPDLLLDVADVGTLDPDQQWQETGTTDNTEGDGINFVCQSSRFADPRGEGALVRTFSSQGTPVRNVTETVEVSATTTSAVDAYRTTLGWFAGCSEARLQLLGSYRVTGIGAQGEILQLRLPTDDGRRTFAVGVVRTGQITLTTAVETVDGPLPDLPRLSALMRSAVDRVCGADAAGSCPREVEVARVLPPPSGEARGTLATADLPPVSRVREPWVGTRPAPARPNPASTPCDRANFVRSGAPDSRSRSYLIPDGGLPQRFGVTQTVGQFPGQPRARGLADRVVAAMRSCEDDDPSAQVTEIVVDRDAFRGSTVAVWRLDSEIAEDEQVSYWMGIARVGPYLTQVLLTPTPGADVDQEVFRALTIRARDRLFELSGGAR